MDSGGKKDYDIVKLLYSPESSPCQISLASSILYCRNLWDTQVTQVIDDVEEKGGFREWALMQHVIASCSDAVLTKYYNRWSILLIEALKVNKDKVIHSHLCEGISSLLERAHESPKAVPDFSKQKLPLLLQALLCFSSSPTSLQLPAIRVVALCHAWFAMGQNQSRAALQKWAEKAIFDPHTTLSMEGARLMALLCHHSNQKWGHLVESATGMLEFTLEQIYSPRKKGPKGKSFQCTGESMLQLPRPLPVAEPERTAYLFQLVHQYSRVLNTSLLLPPNDHAHLPSVPVERILMVVLHGLGRRPPPGNTVECRVLEAALPIIRTSLVNVLGILLRTCQTHLLPYASYVRSALIDEISLALTQQSSTHLAAVFRVSSLWVGVAKDYDSALIKTLVHALLDLSESAQMRHVQLQHLCEMLEVLGPSVQESVSIMAVQRLPFEKLSPQTTSDEVLILLRLLVASMRCRGPLCPPMGRLLQLLTDLACSHPDKKVQSTSVCILSQCNLLMHPSVPPLPYCAPVQTGHPLPSNVPTIPQTTNGIPTTRASLLSHQARPYAQVAPPPVSHAPFLSANKNSSSQSKSSSADTSHEHFTRDTTLPERVVSQTLSESLSQKRRRSESNGSDIDKRPRREGSSGSQHGNELDEDGPLAVQQQIASEEAQSAQVITDPEHTRFSSAMNIGGVYKGSLQDDQPQQSPPGKEEEEVVVVGSESDEVISGAELFIDESSDSLGDEEDSSKINI